MSPFASRDTDIKALLTLFCMFSLVGPLVFPAQAPKADEQLPTFGRDTVLVYKSSSEGETTFVVRIAEFTPDRHIEWEDATAQGTVFIPAKAVNEARAFASWRLFQAGVDTLGKDTTTLWMSRRMFFELKEKGKAKFDIDSISTWVTLLGKEQLEIEVNGTLREVPVIKTRDERGMERWFLDMEDNPLIAKFRSRN